MGLYDFEEKYQRMNVPDGNYKADIKNNTLPRTKIEILLLICLLLAIINANAQISTSLSFESLNINNGLSQGFISSIIQDKSGLMWFATSDGLNKYDGTTFTIYHHDPDDPASIGSDDLACLFEDSKGRLWIGTRNNGLDLFDRENHIFTHIRHKGGNSIRSDNIQGITEDKTGALWIRTKNGIDRLEITDQKYMSGNFTGNYFYSKYKLSFTHIKLNGEIEAGRDKYGSEKVFTDSRNHVFITTNNSVLELKYNAAKNTYITLKKFSYAVSDSSFIPDLLEDTIQHCLLLNRGKIIKFYDYNFGLPLEIYRYNELLVRWTIDKNDVLWLAEKNKIVRLSLKSGENNSFFSADPLQLKATNTSTVFYTDHTGVIWIGSGGYGILKYDPEKELFHQILPELSPYQILENKNKKIIINTFQEINIKKNKPVSVSQLIDVNILKIKFPKIGVVSFAEDSTGNLWLGIHGGIIKYDIKTKNALRYDIPFKDLALLPFPVFTDSRNNIWMGYGNYLVRYTPSPGKFTRYSYPLKSVFYEYDFLQCIYEDHGFLWLGLVNGLLRFDIETGRMKDYYFNQENDKSSLSNNFIFSITNDFRQPQKYLWIGTKGGGLNRLNKLTGRFTRYNIKDGLANNVIYGILPDDHGNLWLSTNKGLSEFNPVTRRFRNFNVSDGLQSNEFNRYAYCKTSEGLMVFGGMSGINYFDPKDIKTLEPPDVILTDFRLKNKSVGLKDPESPLKKDIGFTKEMHLLYKQNVVTFVFAGMDYRKKGSIIYRYMMEGFDKDWIYSGTVHEATYTNLNPGDYRFIVQGSFVNGLWGKRNTSMNLHVIPPWWRTWWFYILSTTGSLSGTYMLYRYRLFQLTKLDSLRNRIARDLHDEVGSSISTIAIYSKIVHDQLGSATFDNEPLLKKISEHATEIMEAMNDIVWNINTKNDVFENIINRMREHAYQLFEAKGYTLHFDFNENLYRMKLEMEKRRDFYLIYKEALNNIAKYANGKNVWITVDLKNSEIVLVIIDDGQGFDINAVKTKSNGLNNMNFRAASLNGTLNIVSTPGEGTSLYLSF